MSESTAFTETGKPRKNLPSGVIELDDSQVEFARRVAEVWRKGRELDARLRASMHRDGVAWYDAPLPRRWHHCFAQSSLNGVQRCPCGAMNRGAGWAFKNERRNGIPFWSRIKAFVGADA